MPIVLSPPTSLWCADRLVAGVDGPGLQRSYTFDRPFVVVGTSPRCDIVLPLLDGPPVALYLHATADAIHWLDLTSPQAQWRSGAFDKTGCLVWRGYHLALERVRSEVESRSDLLPADARHPNDRLDDAAVFDVTFDGERLARAKLSHVMTLVGQSPRCRLRLRNRHVSDVHCLYYVCGRRAWVIDLASATGTFVGEEAVAVREVVPGDAVRLGKPRMTMVRWNRRKVCDADLDADTDEADDVGALSDVDMEVDDNALADDALADDALYDDALYDDALADETVEDPDVTVASLTDTVVGGTAATVVDPHAAPNGDAPAADSVAIDVAVSTDEDETADEDMSVDAMPCVDTSVPSDGEAPAAAAPFVAADDQADDEAPDASDADSPVDNLPVDNALGAGEPCAATACVAAEHSEPDQSVAAESFTASSAEVATEPAASFTEAESAATPDEASAQIAPTEAPPTPSDVPPTVTADAHAAEPSLAEPSLAESSLAESSATVVPPPVWPSPSAAVPGAQIPTDGDEEFVHPVLNQLIERHRQVCRRRMWRFVAGLACGAAVLGAVIAVLHVYGPL